MVKGAGIAAAGVVAGCAGVGVAHADESWMPQWDYEADLVVLGLGAAGASAAITAADAGLKVIVVESADHQNAGGATSVSGGIFAVARRPWLGHFATPEMLEKSTMGVACPGFAEGFIDGANEVIEFSKNIGMPVTETDMMVMASSTVEGYSMTGYALFEALQKAVEERADNITVLYETPAIDVVQDPMTREVYGAVAGTKDQPVYLKAKRGVLIATGGYEANQQMMQGFHQHSRFMPNASGPYTTGMGARIGMKAGGDFRNTAWCYEIDNWCIKPASEELGCAVHASFSPSASLYGETTPGFIFVNKDGQRFMNERQNIGHSKSTLDVNDFFGGTATPLNEEATIALDGYRNWPCFAIFDSTVMDGGPITNPREAGWLDSHPHRPAVYEWSSDNRAELERGWLFKGETLEELAEAIQTVDEFGNPVSMNTQGLLEAVQRYNEGCAAGQDEYGRAAAEMAPVAEGPFYAVELCIGVLYTIGGLFHDSASRLLDGDNEAIPRLYAAGNVGTNSILRSEGISGAMLYGIAAARDVAGLDAWDA